MTNGYIYNVKSYDALLHCIDVTYANDADDILALINKDELELQDDGNVKGLDKAIESLKESKPYLFAESKPSGRTPDDGTTTVVIKGVELDNKTSLLLDNGYEVT